MCGLVGVAGNLDYNDRKAFGRLLILDVVRGHHSTGVASVDKHNNVKLSKKKGVPWHLFTEYTTSVDKSKVTFTKTIPDGHEARVLIGHNRLATKGEINDENAHPFQRDHIVGAHNGTLTDYYLNNLEDHKEFEVDSEVLLHNIATKGLETTYKNLHGAWAITWWNQKEQMLYFIRNEKRPLFYCTKHDKSVLYWASEAWMLERIIEEFNINTFSIEDKGERYDIFPFEKDKLYWYNPDPTVKTGKFTVSKESYKSYSPPVHYGRGYAGNGHSVWKNGKQQQVANTSKVNNPTPEVLKARDTFVNKRFPFQLLDHEEKFGNHFSGTLITDPYCEIRLYLGNVPNKVDLLRPYLEEKWFTGVVKNISTVRSFNDKGKMANNYILYMDPESISVPRDWSECSSYEEGCRADNESGIGFWDVAKDGIKGVKEAGNIITGRFPDGDVPEKDLTLVPGYDGALITTHQWMHRTRTGCCLCGDKPDPDEAPDLLWVAEDLHLCEDCASDPVNIDSVRSWTVGG